MILNTENLTKSIILYINYIYLFMLIYTFRAFYEEIKDNRIWKLFVNIVFAKITNFDCLILNKTEYELQFLIFLKYFFAITSFTVIKIYKLNII